VTSVTARAARIVGVVDAWLVVVALCALTLAAI
jgi:hypothetical protein